MTVGASLRKPETLAQAEYFHSLKVSALRRGLCDSCATASAYGAQHGYGQVDRPCVKCEPIVELMPIAQTNGWRSENRTATRNAGTGGLPHPGEAAVVIGAAQHRSPSGVAA